VLEPGSRAPDGEVRTLDGDVVRLGDAWREGRTALLVFLRHLG
jgi:hypothetical protein